MPSCIIESSSELNPNACLSSTWLKIQARRISQDCLHANRLSVLNGLKNMLHQLRIDIMQSKANQIDALAQFGNGFSFLLETLRTFEMQESLSSCIRLDATCKCYQFCIRAHHKKHAIERCWPARKARVLSTWSKTFRWMVAFNCVLVAN